MRHFEELLQELFQKVVVMGTIAEEMIQMAVRVLLERNEGLVAQIMDQEQQVNSIQVEIDEQAVKLTALQQPVASDARFLFMASRIGGELERIADLAINITQNAHFVIRETPLKPLVDVPIMADVAKGMVRNAMTAMIKRDVKLADLVMQEERQVDAFRDQIFRTLLTYMMADPGTIQRALSLILISRNLERIGDHATNIAEEIIYWIQGRDIRHSKPHMTFAPGAGAGAAGTGPSREMGQSNGNNSDQTAATTVGASSRQLEFEPDRKSALGPDLKSDRGLGA